MAENNNSPNVPNIKLPTVLTLNEPFQQGMETPVMVAQPKDVGIATRVGDSSEIVQLLVRNVRQIVVCTLFCFTAVMAWTAYSRPEFTSTAQLYLGELGKRAQSMDGPNIDSSGGNVSDLGTELKVMQSRTLIDRAILESGLNTAVTPADWTRPGYLEWRINRRNPELVDAGYHRLYASKTSLAESVNSAREYLLTFTSDVAYRVQLDGALIGEGVLGTPASFGELTLLLHPGQFQGPHAGESYKLKVSPLWETEELVDRKLEISAPKVLAGVDPTKVITLNFASETPRRSSTFLQELVKAYLGERQAWRSEEADAAERFVGSQLEATRQKLDRLQQQLAAYRTQNKGVILNSEADSLVQQIAKYEEGRVAAQLEVATLTHIEKALQGPNPPLEAFMVGEPRDPVLVEMASNLAEQRNKLLDLGTRYSPSASEYKQAQAQLEAQVSTIRGYVTNKSARAQDSLARIASVIGQYEHKLRAVPAAEFGLAQLSRETEVYNSLYASLLKRQQESAILRASTVSMNRVLDAPDVSYKESGPKLWLRLLSAPFGAVLGILWVLARGLTSSRFESAADAERTLSMVPVLANIPVRRKQRRSKTGAANPFDLLAVGAESGYVEAFRILRTNLYRTAPSGGQIVLFTSPAHGDGKTSCTLALAALLVADGRSVLVIDVDGQSKTHRSLYNAGASADLRTVLDGTLDWHRAVHPISVVGGEFYAIDTGEFSSAELLSRGAMRQFLTDVRAAYDYVLIDAPNFPAKSEALILAPWVDCVATVARPGNTPRQLAIEHVLRLQEVCARCVLILNGTDRRSEESASVAPPANTQPSVAPRFSGIRPAARAESPKPSPAAASVGKS